MPPNVLTKSANAKRPPRDPHSPLLTGLPQPPPRDNLPAPPALPLPSNLTFTDGKPNVAAIREHFLIEGRLSTADALKIIKTGKDILFKEPNVLKLAGPITVVGDLHGQFYDVLKMFEIGGPVPQTTYLFLGDYVDRGTFSCEVILYLLSLKIIYTQKVFLIRGNHECRNITSYFNFKTECKHKYDLDIYEELMELFDALPLAAVIDDKYFCVHGGLSPELKYVRDIEVIHRFREVPLSGLMNDIMWADPLPEFDQLPDVDFVPNKQRGTSYNFGKRAVQSFLEANNLLTVIRGHEVENTGYKLFSTLPSSNFPCTITIFSAPNYCDLYGNKAAILHISDTRFNIQQFAHVPHPFGLPNFMDVFSWSLPFLFESVSKVLLNLVNVPGMEEDDDEEDLEKGETPEERRIRVRAKVQAITRMMMVYKTLREESETVMRLKGMVSSAKLPPGLLSSGPQALRQAALTFSDAQKLDRINESMPVRGDRRPASRMLTSDDTVDFTKAYNRYKARVSEMEPSSTPGGGRVPKIADAVLAAAAAAAANKEDPSRKSASATPTKDSPRNTSPRTAARTASQGPAATASKAKAGTRSPSPPAPPPQAAVSNKRTTTESDDEDVCPTLSLRSCYPMSGRKKAN